MIDSEFCRRLHKKRTMAAISVLKKLNEKFSTTKSKKSLLDEDSEKKIYLQVTLRKIPRKNKKRMIKIHLPHSLDPTEVCLITRDLEKNNKKADVEPTILHYKELLKKCGVKGIAEVVPLRQLRTEYKTYESKRQLSAAYDLFINDKKITGCLPRALGKTFYESRKFPTPINLDTSNLKDQVERAISKTVFSLSCRGNSCTSEVARLSMEDGDIMENILSCVEILSEKLPGNGANVLGLYIKTARSEGIPIYMCYDNAVGVNPKELVQIASTNLKESKEKNSSHEVDIETKRKRKLTKELVEDTSNEAKEESCSNEVDILHKIKKRKTKKQNNKQAEK